MNKNRILIVEDDVTLRQGLFRLYNRDGNQVVTAENLEAAKKMAQLEKAFDLAVVDMLLPDGNGLQLIPLLKNVYPGIQIIVLTAHGSIEDAVKATKEGAYHFLTKPFNIEELSSLSEKALSHKALKVENSHLRMQLHAKYQFDNIIGTSDEIRHVLEMIERVADSDSTVLITGESGTGKELVAKAIHYNSNRSEKPFVPINCGAIPRDLLESELFGHVKGAFTGAIANRIGRFEMAQSGTLFLDEIGEMDPNLQVKILRAIQERRFEPVGGHKSHDANVRIIAATNVNLEKAVADNRFREDLYYRLNVIPIAIPPLRQRSSDIPILLNHFMKIFNRTKSRSLSAFSSDAMDALLQYNWPGNIRELENLVERLAILKGSGEVQLHDLPDKIRQQQNPVVNKLQEQDIQIPDLGLDFNSTVDSFENSLILTALKKTGWNRNQAAALLRLNRTTLVEKIKKKGLTPPPEANM